MMPKENRVDGKQDRDGSKQSDQAGKQPTSGSADQGIVRERGEEQPADKERAQTAVKTEPE